MQVFCPECNARIISDHINLDNMMAKCKECHALFSVRDHDVSTFDEVHSAEDSDGGWSLNTPSSPSDHHVQSDRTIDDLGPPPKGISVDAKDHYLFIKRRWFRWSFIFLTFFCLFWDGFLVVWYTIALSANTGSIGVAFILFPLIHVAVGLGLTYYTVAGYLNSTYLMINSETLRIQHKPLPWFGQCEVNLADVKQFYCKERVRRTKNGRSYSYELSYIDANKRHHKLLGNLPDASSTQYLEDVLEIYLGIKDRRVHGEYPKG